VIAVDAAVAPRLDLAAVRRTLAAVAAVPAGGDAPVLERTAATPQEAPRTRAARAAEGDAVAVRRVPTGDTPPIAAFLDGRQVSRVAAWVGGGPVVFAEVAAVIRVRHDRQLSTWRPAGGASPGVAIGAALYAPVTRLPRAVVGAVRARGLPLVDTAPAAGEEPPTHPMGWTDRAYHAVQEARERLELALAARWVADGDGLLYVDGGLAKEDVVARAAMVVGVVKSHRTLYATGEGLDAVLGLGAGERSTAVVVESTRRTPVLSWYARLRAGGEGDPFWGLARLEAALLEDEPPDARTARLDALTRAVMRETAPLALPDPRWPVMAYGIRDCEEYLRAVVPG
jgi:hypothetical protein